VEVPSCESVGIVLHVGLLLSSRHSSGSPLWFFDSQIDHSSLAWWKFEGAFEECPREGRPTFRGQLHFGRRVSIIGSFTSLTS
jgi:hypothetical protein